MALARISINKKHWGLIPLLASIVVYWNILDADFTYDDRAAIITNEDVIGSGPWYRIWYESDFWGNPIRQDGSHKSFRPVITMSFRWQFQLHGLNASLYHALNLAIHSINCWLVYKLALIVLTGENNALITSLIFSLHPINTEATCSVVGRADLLSTTLILLSLLLYQRKDNLQLVIFLSLLSILCKETAIIHLPLIAIFQVLFLSSKKCSKRVVELIGATCLICYLRLTVNDFKQPIFSRNDNPIAHEESIITRTLTFLYLPVFNTLLILFPKNLCFDWSLDSIPMIKSINDYRVPQIFIFYIFIGFSLLKLINKDLITAVVNKVLHKSSTTLDDTLKDNCQLLFIISFIVLPYLMYSNLFTYVGFVVAERVLYLPSVGFSLIIGFVYKKYSSNHKDEKIANLLIVILLCSYSQTSSQRVKDWKNDEMLFKSAVPINPAKAYANLGYVYSSKNELRKAQQSYLKSLEHRPTMADTWYNLAILTKQLNQTKNAIDYYKRAIRYRYDFPAAKLNLALLLWEQHESRNTSLQYLDECITANPANSKNYQFQIRMITSCAFNKGKFLYEIQEYYESIIFLNKAVSLAPPNYEHLPSIYHQLGLCHMKIGDKQKSDDLFTKSLEINPLHVNSYLSLANLRIKQNRSSEAAEYLLIAFKIAPNSLAVIQNLAHMHYLKGDFHHSVRLYKQVLEQDPNNFVAINGIANVLREYGENVEAEQYYEKMVKLKPFSFESLADYGAILHANKKYEEALVFYEKALQIRPLDRITLGNRKKLLKIIS